MTMRLMLVDDRGTVLDSTGVDEELWKSCQNNERDAWALLTSLQTTKHNPPIRTRMRRRPWKGTTR